MVEERPEAIRGSRSWMAYVFVLGSALLALGEAYRVGRILHEPSRQWPWSGESLGYYMVATGFVVAVAALSLLLQPARLILTPEELIQERPWSRRSWKWRDIGAFRVELGEYRNKVIRFARRDPQPGQLHSTLAPQSWEIASGWTMGLDQVCARLNAARERWS